MGYRKARKRRLLQYEWNKNIACRKYQYLVPMIVALQMCIQAYFHVEGTVTLTQFLDRFLEGMPHMGTGSRASFLIPGDWCVFCIFLVYMTGKSSKDFTEGVGQQILLRAEDASSLWSVKCSVCIANSLIYFGSAYVSIILFFMWETKSITSLFQIGLGWDVNQFLAHFFLPVLTACVIGVWQMVISMLSNALFSVLGISVLLIVSAYFENSILIGNYLMKLRVQEFLDSGISYTQMIVYLLLLLAAAYYVGVKVIRRLDYIHVKGDL